MEQNVETEVVATEMQDRDIDKRLAMQDMETMATNKEKIGIR